MYSQNETIINGLYARIDWLEFTITELNNDLSLRDNVDLCLKALGLHIDLFDEQGKGGFGYKASMRHMYENIFVFYDGSAEMGIHFRVSGYAVTYLLKRYLETMAVDTPFGKGYELIEKGEKKELKEKIRKSLGLDNEIYEYDTCNVMPMFIKQILDIGRFTRIDLAIDDIGAQYFTVNDVYEYLDKGFVVCKFKQWQNVKGSKFDGESIGHTVYMGSRQSDVYLRVYEKGLEQGLNIPWTRWELEIKHEKADIVARQLVEIQDFGKVTIGLLKSYLRIIKVDNARRSRCSINDVWALFTSNVEKLGLKLPERVKTIDDKKKWIEKQCLPTLAGLIVAGGGDISFIRNDLEKNFDRLKVKDRKMFLEAFEGGKDDN